MLLIKNINVYLENKVIAGDVLIKNGIIQEIAASIPCEPDTIINGTGLNLIPGFIDTHIHGANGADVMDATPEALDKMASYLVTEGTTSFLATTITQAHPQIEAALCNVATYQQKEGTAQLLGVHLEGPFVEKSKAGAQPEQYICQPDLLLFKHWQALADNKIKTITIAPEHDHDGSFIQALREQGVNVSAGHTNAGFSELKRAVDRGVNQLTHLCNAMNGIHHRDIGAVGAAFLSESLKAEIIADGIHVDPSMLELIYKNIGSERLILITDAMRAKGLPSGNYELGGQPVFVSQDRAVLEDGTLAGSILNMIDGAKQLLNIPDVKLEDIIKMAAINPAKQLGIFKQKGSIKVGKDADLLIVDDALTLNTTIAQGKIVFQGGAS
ncbi:N-acetylglucosamine-6-phosphate deacetylase [Amphibacillus marinus]|uniref:N-acetylglucosamine-6-phosphate deacetylase n=1 Tax=Amphibacillus marinus TaxID=872970 RepID=A0A1H8MJN3_9BACI|nr:N-acetylglucosamine-6-phosphate deacetylase [Amphibacillus marinus]SEO17631.1 N-acetylglucosamine-6-phosphate deacetylase [Amphibacillus marinus]